MAEQCTGRGPHGVVVAAAPMAASIGAAAMRCGGNAFDAALAALLAEVVLLPPKCGLAGDLVALHLAPGGTEPFALLAIGTAPRALGPAVRELGALPDTGPLSVGIPGAPAGYAALAARGRLPLAELAQPAIDLARDGVPWARICSVLAQESASLVARHSPGGTRYYPAGRTPAPGELIRLPGLAAALEELVVRGARLFDGPVGDAVCTLVQEAGGVLERDEVASALAEWVPAARGRSGGWNLWSTPAPTHGPSLLDAMASLDADADAADLLRAIDAVEARRSATAGDTAAGTSMVSAADDEGHVLTVVHSNSYPRFGSGLVVDDFDLILANRAGRGFTAEDGHPNFPAPGRRPVTTLHAWAAGRGGGASHLGGTPGGASQVAWNVQALHQLVHRGASPPEIVLGGRWERTAGGTVRVEAGVGPGDRAALAALGRIEDVPEWGLRCAQQVVCRPEPGRAVEGAVDPRTGGLAVGV